HGGAQAGFIILLLFGAPLGAIFGSLLVRKLTGEQESPREKIKHKGFWIALAAVVLVGLGAAWKWDKIRLWYIARSDDGLVGANLRHARLSGVDLTGVNLTKAILAGADLRTANLRGANLEEAILNSARLWGADLSGVNLRGADLQDADLRGATGVSLEGTLGTPAFMPDD
ncbi:MAG: pentapeptide repeat-containing protein, partial [Planctomycetes bacterium]|nr:pentapeptide repeat-containing protein [Planctomycetota bacterium]